MENYFFKMIPEDELARLPYLPTINQLMEKMRTDYAIEPALSNREMAVTYEQLYQIVGHRRHFLDQLGLAKGAKIAVLDRNSIEAVTWFLAITTAGYVAVLLPAALPEPAVLGSIRKFDIEAIFVRDELAPVCANVTIKKFSTKETSASFSEPAMVKKETVAAIFFTGGTTGQPKGVVLTHGNIMRGSYNGIFMPGSVIGGHRYIAFLPFSHVFGLIRGLLSCFYTGALVYTCEDMKETVSEIPNIKPTCLVLVPGLAEMLIGLAKMRGGVGFLGGALKTIIGGAANVPPKLIADFDAFHIKLLQGYGLTESSNLVSGNANFKDKPTSVGQVYPEQEIKIVDGELWLKGDHIFQGYYHDEEATKAAFEDGWFKTGDLARVDDEGFLYIVGRIKNLIILKNGENVSPESIEEPFYAIPFIKDCLVKEDVVNGEHVIAIEILPQMAALQGLSQEEIVKKMNEVVEKINDTLPSYSRIMKVTVRTEDFKRSGSMKILRNQ